MGDQGPKAYVKVEAGGDRNLRMEEMNCGEHGAAEQDGHESRPFVKEPSQEEATEDRFFDDADEETTPKGQADAQRPIGGCLQEYGTLAENDQESEENPKGQNAEQQAAPKLASRTSPGPEPSKGNRPQPPSSEVAKNEGKQQENPAIDPTKIVHTLRHVESEESGSLGDGVDEPIYRYLDEGGGNHTESEDTDEQICEPTAETHGGSFLSGMGANYIRGAAPVNVFTGLAYFVQTSAWACRRDRVFTYVSLMRLMRNFKQVGLLVVLLVAIPARGETAGFAEMRDAVGLWHRVFGRVPALEQFIRGGKAPDASSFGTLEATLNALSGQEASNPFHPLAKGALFTLTKRGDVRKEASKASELAGDRVAVRWLLYQTFLRLEEKKAADREIRRIRTTRDRLGLDRIAYLGGHLAHSAEALAARHDTRAAEEALKLAIDFDSVAPSVSFAQARILLRQGSPRGFLALMKGWWVSFTSPFHGLNRWVNVLASLLIVIPFSVVLVGLVLLLRVTPLFRHDLAEWRRRRLSPATEVFLPFAVYLLPLIFGFGLLPAVLLSLLPLGIYLKGRERLLWGIVVLSLLLLPGGYRLLATVMTSTTTPRYVALLRFEEGDRSRGTETTLLRWAEEAPHDPLPRLYLGRIHRARGQLKQGIEMYSRVKGGAAHEAVAWTNRGNLAFLRGELAEAQTAYKKAIALSPELPYPRFNLSQLLTDRLLFEEAQQEYAQAIHEMPSLESRMRQVTADGRKRVLIDAPLPVTDVWRQILLFDSASPSMAENLWAGRFLGVPLATLPWMVGGYIFAFVGVLWLRKRRRFARACQQCGRAFCSRCQRLLGEVRFCTRCAILERARMGEAPPSIKNLSTEEIHREPRWIGMALALVPGTKGLYGGKTLRGFLILAVALLIVSSVFGEFLAPGMYLPGASLPYHLPAGIVLLFCLYLLSTLIHTESRPRRRKERRWR